VATYFGEAGYVANLYRYAAQDLVLPKPQPIDTIATGLRRGNQMAFDQQGNLCVASYFGQTVRCFDPNNHAQTFDYNAELAPSGILPGGIAFDAQNHLYISGFLGQAAVEQVPHVGPITIVAQGLANDCLFATLDGTGLYATSSHDANTRLGYCLLGDGAAAYACNDYDFTADTIYKIGPNGASNFITSHVWGSYQMIFVAVTKHRP
jgi:hypothetical protein